MKDDSIVFSSLEDLKSTLNGDPIILSQVKRQIEQVSQFDGKAEVEYLNALLHPETIKGVKIPSQMPIPSATFHLKGTFDLIINANGCVFGHLHPFFLADDSLIGLEITFPISSGQGHGYINGNLSTLFVTNATDLNGTTTLEAEIGTQYLSQMIPTGIYDQYRLVSASMKIYYTGSLDVASGVIGGAIVLGEGKTIFGGKYKHSKATDAPSFGAAGYGNEYTVFNRLRYAPYFRENTILEGLRMLYFPVDNSYNEFKAVVGRKNYFTGDTPSPYATKPYYNSYQFKDFAWYFYVQGGPVGKSFRLEMDCNFEVLPSAAVLNYMPISVYPEHINPRIIKKIYNEVMQKAIGKHKCLK